MTKKTKKLLLLIAAIVLCAGLIGLVFQQLISRVNNYIRTSNVESMEELTLHDERSIYNSIQLRWSAMEALAEDIKVSQWTSMEDLVDSLYHYVNNLPSASALMLMDEEETQYLSNGVVRAGNYLEEVVSSQTGRFVLRANPKTWFYDNVKERLITGIPVDFEVLGHKMKWLVAFYPINTLESELRISNYGGQGYSSVVDQDGNYILNISVNHSFMEYDNYFEDLEDAVFQDYADAYALMEAAESCEGTLSAVYTQDGKEQILVITAMDFAPWYFISIVPAQVFDTQANNILRLFVLVLAGTAAVMLLIVVMILRQRRQKEKVRIAETASKSKTEFLFNMSHDIRTPMNAIIGYTEMGLRHGDDKERTRESLRKIQMAGGHLLNLINDILEMSRIESGKLNIAENPLDVRQSLANVQHMSEALAVAKSITFITKIEDVENPYVFADELHMNEVLINLISNAVKYTGEGGTVTFLVRQNGKVTDGKVNYHFEVTDTGIGMSAEFQEHLFEAFSREQTAEVSKQEGAGLGLSIVKKIVDLCGGTISAKSKPGQGSTFLVDVPFRVMTPEEIVSYQQENKDVPILEVSSKSLEGKRILLVEDNEMNREIAEELLTEAGLVVEEAEDGLIALNLITKLGGSYYDAVLMDINMPVMNGYEATRAIRKLPGTEKLPIIALSANAFDEDREQSLASGMNDHLAKPIDVKALFKVLNQIMK